MQMISNNVNKPTYPYSKGCQSALDFLVNEHLPGPVRAKITGS